MFSIDRYILWQYVYKKINRSLNKDHVLNIMIILFEELISDLKNGKKIVIPNFGSLYLKETKPRLYFNIVYQKLIKSKGCKILKFDLNEKLKEKLRNSIDFEKTFGIK